MAARGKLPPLTRESLFPRRVAVRALATVLDLYGLNGVSIKLNADDPEQAFPGATPGEIRLYEEGGHTGKGRAIAYVFLDLEELRARVVVDRIKGVVRRAHRKDLRPEEFGRPIVAEVGKPDVDMEVPLEALLDELGEAMLTAPQRPITRRRSRARGTVYASALQRGRKR
jgi:hypothetical protein